MTLGYPHTHTHTQNTWLPRCKKIEKSAVRFGYFLSSGFNQKVFRQSQNSIRIFCSPLMTAVFRPLFLTSLTFVTLVSTISVTSILSRDSTCNLRNADYNHGKFNSTCKKTSPCGSFMCLAQLAASNLHRPVSQSIKILFGHPGGHDLGHDLLGRCKFSMGPMGFCC